MKGSSIVSLLVGILVGSGVGWVVRSHEADENIRSLAVAHHLEQVTFAANSLSLLTTDLERVDKLQLFVLRSALARLDEITQEPVEMNGETPSLREGLRRAKEYAETNELPALANKADRIMKRLFPAA